MLDFSFRSAFCAFCMMSCSSAGSYTHYLVDPDIFIDENYQEKTETENELLNPYIIYPDQVMKVTFNDGLMFSEVHIPLLNSGQKILIKPSVKESSLSDQAPRFMLPPPSRDDIIHTQLDQAYRSRGLQVNEAIPEMSLSKARDLMEGASRQRQYTIALQYASGVLKRYPDHPEFLKASGSLLILLGEKEKGLEAYEKSQNVEYDPLVDRKMADILNS